MADDGGMDPRTDAAARYAARAARFREEAERQGRRVGALANARLVLFVALAAALVWREVGGAGAALWTAAALAAGFIVLVVLQARERGRERTLRALAELNEEWLARAERRWDLLPAQPAVHLAEGHPYAADLDIFGRASLYALLGPPATAPGRWVLERWLLEPSSPEEIAARQEAVRELAGHVELREALALDGRRFAAAASADDVARFLAWAEQEPWLIRRPGVILATRVLPVVTALLAALQLAGMISGHWWLLPVLAAFGLTRAFRKRIHATFDGAAAERGGIGQYSVVLGHAVEARLDAPLLRRLQADLAAGGLDAPGLLRRAERLLDLADLRFNGMFYLPLQLLTLWDFHVLARLEAWQQVAGPHVRRWLEAYGELEALTVLARLAHDNPDWAFPVFDAEAPAQFVARGLAHPLLPARTRVANDVTVGPPGTFLFVTGSNMSGKSTLLRAIGTNAVLAQAGAPVCAAALRLAPVRLETSMRVQDSLERGVSFFMAELERLRQVVDAAREARRSGGALLYLLDEPLQGTNTAERQIATRTIMSHLLELGAIGAIATHDLGLADCDELRAAARAVHFRETVHGTADGAGMTFDYILRPGVATSSNALRLMELMGLRPPVTSQ